MLLRMAILACVATMLSSCSDESTDSGVAIGPSPGDDMADAQQDADIMPRQELRVELVGRTADGGPSPLNPVDGDKVPVWSTASGPVALYGAASIKGSHGGTRHIALRASRDGIATPWVGTAVEYVDSRDGWSDPQELSVGHVPFVVVCGLTAYPNWIRKQVLVEVELLDEQRNVLGSDAVTVIPVCDHDGCPPDCR
jgi:hypothetical protein